MRKQEISKFGEGICCKFSGRIGNLLSQNTIDYALQLGEQFNIKHEPMNPLAIHSLVWTLLFLQVPVVWSYELIPGRNIIRVLYADQFGGDASRSCNASREDI